MGCVLLLGLEGQLDLVILHSGGLEEFDVDGLQFVHLLGGQCLNQRRGKNFGVGEDGLGRVAVSRALSILHDGLEPNQGHMLGLGDFGILAELLDDAGMRDDVDFHIIHSFLNWENSHTKYIIT